MASTTETFTPEQARESWLAERNRRDYLGASQWAAAMGVSPFQSRVQLWSEKCGFLEPDDLSENELVECGNVLESAIGELFRRRTGRAVKMWEPYKIVRHPLYPWLGCTPDATQESLIEEAQMLPWMRTLGLAQIKNTNMWLAKEWQDEPPLHVSIQCQAELACTGMEWTTAIALIGGNNLRWFDIQRNDEFIDAMIPRLQEFMDLVHTETLPAPDGDKATAKALVKLYPQDDGETVDLPSEAEGWDIELTAAKERIKESEAVKLEYENKIKAAIGNASAGVLPNGTGYSWKTSPRKGYTVAETTVRTLRRLGKSKTNAKDF